MSFTGRTAGKVNVLNWEVSSETDFNHYELERFSTGINGRSAIAEVLAALLPVAVGAAAGAEIGRGSYELVDIDPLAGTYYRLRGVDLYGSSSLNSVVYLARVAAR